MMSVTAGAAFLNTAFAGFDRFFLAFYHKIGCAPLTLLARMITFLGEKGNLFFLAALILMCFSRTRRMGVCLFGAVSCGALITNIILKDLIARPRPFTLDPYIQWVKEIGAPLEDEFSFPSGHATSAAAGMTALWIRNGKKWAVPSVLWVFFTCVSRNYLMAHYPSDVLFGAMIGALSGVIAHLITELIFWITETNRGKGWADFILEWSVPDIAGIPSRLGLTEEEQPEGKNARETGRRQPEVRHSVRKTEEVMKTARESSGYVGKHLK